MGVARGTVVARVRIVVAEDPETVRVEGASPQVGALVADAGEEVMVQVRETDPAKPLVVEMVRVLVLPEVAPEVTVMLAGEAARAMVGRETERVGPGRLMAA